MSHFAVLVIGPNVEEQLAPYHEFECTGLDDQYVQDVDITSEVLEQMAEESEKDETKDALEEALGYFGLEDRVVASEEEVDRKGMHKYSYAVIQNQEGSRHLIKAVRRTNPDKKWDWYVVGGRFSGFLKVKSILKNNTVSGYADQSTKGNVDFEGMRAEAEASAAKKYDQVMEAVGNLDDFKPWNAVREVHKDQPDLARDTYRAQRAVKALHDHYFLNLEDFMVTRDAYLQAARDKAISTYALVMDGKWYAKGEMGWWGMSYDEMSQAAWNQKVSELLNSLPDDTLLTVVDCHI